MKKSIQSKYNDLKKEILAHILKTQKASVYANWKENLSVNEFGIRFKDEDHQINVFRIDFYDGQTTYCCGVYEIGDIGIIESKDSSLITKDLLAKFVSIRLNEDTKDEYLYQITLPYKDGSGKKIKNYEIFIKAVELSGFKLIAKFINLNSNNKLKHYIKFKPCR
jgi:hypothetical protein